MFPAADRRVAFERARGQCEYDRWLLWRCTRTAAHADHFFPWTRGGATNLRNCLAACARCNTSKGAKVPGRMQRLRIQARRRRYFPRGVPVELGDWCRGAS
ncbi:HNH endonuclease [Microbacterium xylanilyticum]